MKTYTIFNGTQRLKDKATLSEAYNLIPAGSEIVSGNKVEKLIVDGKLEDVVTEWRSIFKTPRGDRITIVENQTSEQK